MHSTPPVVRVRFHPADRTHRDRGLCGWVTFEVHGLEFDGIAVRRTLDHRVVLSYPERVASGGRRHATVRPVHDNARVAIEAQVISYLRERGYVS
jgi:hypothetical protein